MAGADIHSPLLRWELGPPALLREMSRLLGDACRPLQGQEKRQHVQIDGPK